MLSWLLRNGGNGLCLDPRFGSRQRLRLPPARAGRRPGTNGKPAVRFGWPTPPGVNLRICNDQGQELPERQIGEIWAELPSTMAGYYNNPTGTAQVFHDGWYKTGDLGYRVGQACFIREEKKIC